MIIYKATNLKNGKVYIGQTIRSLSSRITSHKKVKKCSSDVCFQHYIQLDGIDNFRFEVIRNCDNKQELNFYEKHYIAEYKSNDVNYGYNLTSGGDANYESTSQYREYMMMLSTCKRAIIVYKDSGKYYSEYDSINSASRDLNVDSKSINRILKGVRKTTKGYSFRYKSDTNNTKDITINKCDTRKSIIQVDLHGNEIMRFKSISLAAQYLNLDRSVIQRVLSKKRKSTHGYTFKYE